MYRTVAFCYIGPFADILRGLFIDFCNAGESSSRQSDEMAQTRRPLLLPGVLLSSVRRREAQRQSNTLPDDQLLSRGA